MNSLTVAGDYSAVNAIVLSALIYGDGSFTGNANDPPGIVLSQDEPGRAQRADGGIGADQPAPPTVTGTAKVGET
jgi:hypothetical protein